MLPREAAALPVEEAADDDELLELLQAARKVPNAPAAATVAPPRSRDLRESALPPRASRPSSMRPVDRDILFPFRHEMKLHLPISI
jgi:hypothetical protein